MRALRVAYINQTANLFGSEISMLQCLRTLDRSRVEPLVVTMCPGPFLQAVRDEGVPARWLPWLHGGVLQRRPWRLLPAIWRLSRWLRANRVDVVEFWTHLFLVVPAALLAGCAMVFRPRRPGIPAPRHKRWALAFCRLIIPVSRGCVAPWETGSSKGWWRRLLSRRVRVVPDGRDIEELQSTPRDRSVVRALGIPDAARIVGVTGSLDPVKRPDVFLRAAALIRREEPDVWFLMVGGPYTDAPERVAYARGLERLARELGVADRVVMAGYRPDAPRLMRHFDVFLLASERDALPGVLIEAQAVGVPVVATAVDGVPELVAEGRSGLLVRDGRPESYAAATLSLLRDGALARRMSDEALSQARRFDNARVTRSLESCYFEAFGAAP